MCFVLQPKKSLLYSNNKTPPAPCGGSRQSLTFRRIWTGPENLVRASSVCPPQQSSPPVHLSTQSNRRRERPPPVHVRPRPSLPRRPTTPVLQLVPPRRRAAPPIQNPADLTFRSILRGRAMALGALGCCSSTLRCSSRSARPRPLSFLGIIAFLGISCWGCPSFFFQPSDGGAGGGSGGDGSAGSDDGEDAEAHPVPTKVRDRERGAPHRSSVPCPF